MPLTFAGPLALVPDDVLPRGGDRRTFEGLVAGHVRELQAARLALEGRVGQAVSASGGSLEARAGLTLSQAAHAVDDQPPELDPSIAAVVGAVAALEGELAGLIVDNARDIGQGVPGPPPIPPEREPFFPPPPSEGPPTPPDFPPEDEFAAWVHATWEHYLGRRASDDEVEQARVTDNTHGAIEDGLRLSDERAQRFNALYLELLFRDAEPAAIANMRGGHLSLATLRAGILASDEYRDKHP